MPLPALWITIPIAQEALTLINERFEVIHTKGYGLDAIAQAAQKPVTVVLSNGSIGLSAQAIEALPQLKLIACFGAGFENIDAAARARGIVVTHAPGVNDANVADHALALMLGVARDLPGADRAVRAGKWDSSRIYRPSLNGKRLGVIGLGNIGLRIARRGEAFDMTVAYSTRSPKPGVAWKHYADVVALAENSDYLVAACPGGPATRHLVNAEVLAALGQQGIFVNIARGSVVDTAALIDALERDVIYGAGLDVIDGEPVVPEALMQSPKVLMTPHMAGRTPDVIPNQVKLFFANVDAVMAGKPAPNVAPA